MVSTETLLVVLIVATAANLVLGLVLLVAPRLRRRDGGRTADDAAPRGAAPRGAARAAGTGASGSVGSPSLAGHPVGQARGAGVGPGALHGGFGEGRPLMAMFGPGSGAVPSDPQTGLDAPSTWTRWLHEEEARVRRYRRPATVVLVEIEGLERLVERLGPAAADRLIPPVAATMRRLARDADRVSRLGPARFGAILPETDEVRAINYVERVRTSCDLWLAAGAVSLCLSIGWAETNPSRSMEATLLAAEERLNAERRRAGIGDVVPAPGAESPVPGSAAAS